MKVVRVYSTNIIPSPSYLSHGIVGTVRLSFFLFTLFLARLYSIVDFRTSDTFIPSSYHSSTALACRIHLCMFHNSTVTVIITVTSLFDVYTSFTRRSVHYLHT